MFKENLDDTIAAISTPIGEGGIGIVRLSGKAALKVADKIFVSKDKLRPSEFKSYTMHYGRVVYDGQVLDEAILTLMRSPKSYTREDVVEINCHAGIVALRRLLDLVLSLGCRLAEPGEFTKRAFLNGRIDLAQAEAVIDVIRAKTDTALKISLEQLEGGLSKEINKLRTLLLDSLSTLEANIDFPEEEIGVLETEKITRGLNAATGILIKLTSQQQKARIFREGIHAVICGRPNVGKSSLLNAILRRERSIVTPVAGTTRDTIEEVIDIKGIPVRIVDTAGILEPRDLVEKKAVSRSGRHIQLADLIIILFDSSKRFTGGDQLLINKVKGKKAIAVINKIDLKQRINKEKIKKAFGRVIEISAKKTKNIDLLEEAIVDLICKGEVYSTETVMAGNLRHISLLKEAEKLIAEATNSLDNKLSLEFVAQDIKEALGRLDIILGKNFSAQLLDKIFGNFCIGK